MSNDYEPTKRDWLYFSVFLICIFVVGFGMGFAVRNAALSASVNSFSCYCGPVDPD